jgi:cytochrome P450
MSAIGEAVTVSELEGRSPYALLARLREHEPVSWLPALDGWLVTRHDLALTVMRDAATYTVQDPRFTTGQVVGPSMLSLDGDEHARHRAPFVPPLRLGEVRARLAQAVGSQALRLARGLAPDGGGELRRGFAGPLAASVITRTLGLDPAMAGEVLRWYDAIVAAVTDLSAGRPPGPDAERAMVALRTAVRSALAHGAAPSLLRAAGGAGALSEAEVASNAAIVLFGAIETMEGMIANALVHLLGDAEALAAVRTDRALLSGAIEESLRLEPAAAAVDRYAATVIELGGAPVAAGDLVRVSLTAANRDPAVFCDPDRFDPHRANARRHVAFASGPHVCIGVHLARLETDVALSALLDQLPGLRLDPAHPRPAAQGLVFRKPPSVHTVWDPA